MDRICDPIELSAEMNELLENLENLLSLTEQEKKQLSEAISSDFSTSTQTEETQHVPQADPNAIICGHEMECVELWRCKSTKKVDDKYKIIFRELYTYPLCYLNQICCRISDKVGKVSSIQQLFFMCIPF